MIRYYIVGDMAVCMPRKGSSAVRGRVTLSVPDGCTLYLNGRPYSSPTGQLRLPVSALRAENTVSLRCADGVHGAEGLLWDGIVLKPVGYDSEALLLAVAAAQTEAAARIAELQTTVARLVGEVETPLFS